MGAFNSIQCGPYGSRTGCASILQPHCRNMPKLRHRKGCKGSTEVLLQKAPIKMTYEYSFNILGLQSCFSQSSQSRFTDHVFWLQIYEFTELGMPPTCNLWFHVKFRLKIID